MIKRFAAFSVIALIFALILSGKTYAISSPVISFYELENGLLGDVSLEYDGSDTVKAENSTQVSDASDSGTEDDLNETPRLDANYSTGANGATVSSSEDTVHRKYISPDVSVNELKESLSVQARSEGSKVLLSWNNSEGVKYNVYRIKGKKKYRLAVVSGGTYIYKNAKNNTTYEFVIESSGNDNKHTGRCSIKVYYKPAVSVQISDGKATLKWNKVPNTTKYAIYRYSNGKLTRIGETSKTAVRLSVKDKGDGYAVKAFVDGAWSKVYRSDIVWPNDQ